MEVFNFKSYYRFERLPHSKSATRFDCTAIGGESNADFEKLVRTPSNGAMYIYVTHGHRNLRLDPSGYDVLSIDKNKNHISKIFAYNDAVGDTLRGYGDIKGTKDALIIELSADGQQLDIFISPNGKALQTLIYEAYASGNAVTEESASALKSDAVRL